MPERCTPQVRNVDERYSPVGKVFSAVRPHRGGASTEYAKAWYPRDGVSQTGLSAKDRTCYRMGGKGRRASGFDSRGGHRTGSSVVEPQPVGMYYREHWYMDVGSNPTRSVKGGAGSPIGGMENHCRDAEGHKPIDRFDSDPAHSVHGNRWNPSPGRLKGKRMTLSSNWTGRSSLPIEERTTAAFSKQDTVNGSGAVRSVWILRRCTRSYPSIQRETPHRFTSVSINRP